MSNLSESANRLRNGSFQTENVAEFLEGFREKSFVLAAIHLMMSHYSLLLYTAEHQPSREVTGFLEGLNRIIEKLTGDDDLGAQAVTEVRGLREDVRIHTETAINLLCALQNYQYALFRTFSFSDEPLPLDRDDTAREILQFLFGSDDNMVTNIRIAEVIKALPIRFTKDKFFEILFSALDEYKNADKHSLYSLLYKIKQAGMMELSTEENGSFEEISSFLTSLKGLSFKKMTEEEALRLKGELEKRIEALKELIEEFMLIMESVNGLYMVFSTMREGEKSLIRDELSLISSITSYYKNREVFTKEAEEELDTLFVNFVEKNEDLLEDIFRTEDVLDLLKDNFFKEKNEKMSQDFLSLIEINLLRSNPFLHFAEILNNNGSVDALTLNREKQNLKEALDAVFREQGQLVRRAIIAEILGVLPIFLKNRTEVMDYVRSSLSTCDNREELKTCLRLINEIRRENDNY